jgi:hypothetical protein
MGGVNIEHNLLIDLSSAAFYLHCTANTTVTNNIAVNVNTRDSAQGMSAFMGCDAGGYHATGPNPPNAINFTQNVVLLNRQRLLTGMNFAQSSFNDNCYATQTKNDSMVRFGLIFLAECYDWRTSVDRCTSAEANASTFAQWRHLGFDRASIVGVDPKFVDAPYNLQLQAASPLHSLGFKPLDFSHVGVIDNGLLRRLALPPAVYDRYPFGRPKTTEAFHGTITRPRASTK